MLTRHALLALLACAAGAQPLQAQAAPSQQCAATAPGMRDACQKGTDIFTMLMPQVLGALTGGGPVLGSAGSERGLSVGLRVTAIDGDLPTLASVPLSISRIVRSDIRTSRAAVPMPTLDFALPLLPGFDVGAQRILSVDVLANVAYLPSRAIEDFSVRATNGSLKLGWGARVGLIADRLLMPAVSVSYFRRTLPTATFSATLNTDGPLDAGVTPDSITLGELSVRSDAIRLAASKRLGFLELGGGIGEDSYRSFAQLRLRVNTTATQSLNAIYVVKQELKRRAAFGSAALNLPRLRLAAEAGTTFGGDSVATFNTFTDGRVNANRLFASVGARLRF